MDVKNQFSGCSQARKQYCVSDVDLIQNGHSSVIIEGGDS